MLWKSVSTEESASLPVSIVFACFGAWSCKESQSLSIWPDDRGRKLAERSRRLDEMVAKERALAVAKQLLSWGVPASSKSSGHVAKVDHAPLALLSLIKLRQLE